MGQGEDRMQGFLRAMTRLAVMVFVMAVVLFGATAIGMPTAVVLGSSVTVAGVIGMVGLSRRAAGPTKRERRAIAIRAAMGAGIHDPNFNLVVESMDPDRIVDPESLMPRWRRPSLLAARRLDPSRSVRYDRTPMLFDPSVERTAQRRAIRISMVSLLDRPDEIMGRQITDLMHGDEVEVLQATGPFWEVACPDGTRGWLHRTTLGNPGTDALSFGSRVLDQTGDNEDILTTVLSARGLT
jgi:hypothetical protein